MRGTGLDSFMSATTDPTGHPSAESGAARREILSGDRDALAAIELVVSTAKRRLLVFDHDLKSRGYNSPQRFENLRRFLLAGRSNELRIALHETRGLEADCPRLVLLAQQFPHSVRLQQTVGIARNAPDPFVIADESAFWRKLHYQHPRSILAIGDVPDTVSLAERFSEIWESSEPVPVGGATGL